MKSGLLYLLLPLCLLVFSCKKEKIYKGYYQFTMDIGYYYDGEYFQYEPGPDKDSFVVVLKSVEKELLTFAHYTSDGTSYFEQEVFLSVDKHDNVAGNWSIMGVGGTYYLSGKITDYHERGKIEGTVSIFATHDVPPLNLELETGLTAFGPFKLEKIEE